MLAAPKCLKALVLAPKIEPAALFALLKPDLAFVVLMQGLFLALHAWMQKVASGRFAHYVSSGWALLLLISGLYLVSELRFFQATGAFMDVATFIHGLRYFDQLVGVIKAEVSWAWAAGVLLILGGGFLLIRMGLRARALPLRTWVSTLLLFGSLTGLIFLAHHQSQARGKGKLAVLEGTLLLEQAALGADRLLETFGPTEPDYPLPEPVKVSATPESSSENVVIILLESIRFDATTPYTASLDTTPTLARIAREGARVEHAYVALPHTTKALVSVLSGFPPDIRRPLSETTDVGVPATGIATLLKSVGYDSAYFHSAFGDFENNDVLIHSLGYDTYISSERLDKKSFESPNYLGLEDRAMTAPIMQWVDGQLEGTPRAAARQAGTGQPTTSAVLPPGTPSPQKPFLLTVLTLTSHHDYQVPTNFPSREYEGSPRWNGYLNSVRYVDTFVGELLAEFEKRNLMDNTLFVFLGDHGEGHGEHGRKGHDQIMYEEGIRIPLLLYHKRTLAPGTVIDGTRWNIDVLPTIIDLLGLQVDSGKFEGYSLRSPADAPPIQGRVIYSSCWIEDQCISRMWEHKKYIHYYGKQKDEYFDLTADPRETVNRIDTLSVPDQQKYIDDILAWKTHIRKTYLAHKLVHSQGYVSREAPDVARPLHATFEPSLEVIGYDISQPLTRGNPGRLMLTFKVRRNLVGGWKLLGEIANDAGELKTVKLKQVKPDTKPESWAPDTYYTVEYSFQVPPRASLASPSLYLSVESEKNVRRAVTGLNTDREKRAVKIPISIER